MPGQPGSGRLLAALPALALDGLARDQRRVHVVENDLTGDDDLRDVLAAGHLVHHVEEDLLHDGAQAAGAGAAQQRLVGDRLDGVLGELQLDTVDLEQPAVLLHERVLRLGKDLDQRVAVQRRDGGDDREPADELRDQAELEQVLRHHVAVVTAGLAVRLRLDHHVEAERLLADPLLHDVVQAGERAADDEQHVRGVDLDELLVRVLAPALRRHAGRRTLQDLQQGLLNTFAGHVARDRRVLALAGDLVDLVDVDDAGLGLLDVVVGGLDQLQQDVLDVLTDVPRLGQGSGVGDRERDVEHPGERLREVGLAAARRADQQDVRLGELDRVVPGVPAGGRGDLAVADALVVVVHRHREGLLGHVLADDVLVQEVVDLPRLREFGQADVGALVELLLDDLVAEIDALVADVDAGAGDQLLHLLLALSAERALEQVAAIPYACHLDSSLLSRTRVDCTTHARPQPRFRRYRAGGTFAVSPAYSSVRRGRTARALDTSRPTV